MIGFDGDPVLAARLREALARLVDVFPEHVAKPRPPTWFEPREIAWNDQFDAMVRAHKRDRLALPIQALVQLGSPYHNFDLMHLRRLAWFVPSILATWLDRREGALGVPFGSTDIERIFESTAIVEADEWTWTGEEATALDRFFGAALEAALATPLPPPRAPGVGRPREDGVDVWSRRWPSIPMDVIRVARAMRVPTEPLLIAWTSAPTALALDHLLEAVFDPSVAAKHFLAHEVVAARLAEAFFEATGERALRLSKAEAHIRRWIARAET